jgi:small subunit ribosomal protein S4
VLNTPPGAHARTRKPTDYAVRLRAKQRVKAQYGILERSFRRLLAQAQRMPGPTGANLLQLLERRLDNVVYRLGFARTRPMARQIVGHQHILLNGKPVNIPSCPVRPGDRIEVTISGRDIPGIKAALSASAVIPAWLRRDEASAQVVALPERADVEGDIREDLIVEYYAR